MQAETRLKHNPGACPLCNAPLATTGESSSPHHIHVICSSCGYSAPFVQRQHTTPSPTQQPSVASRSSVWIDPAVSPFLTADSKESTAYPPGLPVSKRKNPVTPIPPRASAQRPSDNVKVRPKYARTHIQPAQEDSDVTRIPTLPPPSMWQFETPDFEIESSLPSLSLVVDASTHPEPPLSPKATNRLPDIYEIDTIPPRQVATHHTEIDQIDTIPSLLKNVSHTDIDKIDTLPPMAIASTPVPAKQTPSLALIPAPSLLPVASTRIDQIERRRTRLHDGITDPSSWTAGSASGSPYAQRIADRAKLRRQEASLNLMDYLRWWLLRPGRIEFMLWLGGTLLLVSITFILLLVTAMSFSWFTPVLQNGIVSPLNQSGTNPTSMPTVITTPGLILTLVDKGPLLPGQPLHLRGQGFTPRSQIEFTDEKKHPLLIQDSQSNMVQTSGHGDFTVTLNDSTWASGPHLIIARDVATGHLADILITLAPSPFGKNATVTPALPPGVTATSTAVNGPGGPFPTAVNSTPGIPKPTVGITPTSSPISTPTLQPSPTATPGITPTATQGATPTATATHNTTPTAAIEVTPTLSSSPSSTPSGTDFMIRSAAANTGDSGPIDLGTSLLGSRAWLLMLGYSLSMLMLGIAGVIRRRR